MYEYELSSKNPLTMYEIYCGYDRCNEDDDVHGAVSAACDRSMNELSFHPSLWR